MGETLASIKRRPALWKAPLVAAVALLFLGWLFNTPPGLMGKSDAIGYAVCHRIELRSFHFGERQLPLCARCTGMYLGALLGLVYQSRSGRRIGTPPRRVLVLLGLLVVSFGADGLNSYLTLFPGAPYLYQPQNWLRLLTGTGMGIAISAALFPAFNQSAWKDWREEPALPNLRSLAGLVTLGLVIDGLVLTENPLTLYPLALLSAASVLVLLTLVYSMVWMIVFKLENRYLQWAELLMPLVGGFGMALLQVVLLDIGRYLLTGTWEGFHFG